jgi:hypothetical protein
MHKVKLHAKVNFKVLVTIQSRQDRLGYTNSENKILLNRRGNPLKGLNISIVSHSGKKNTISKKRPAERSSTQIAASKRRQSKLVIVGISSEVTHLSSQATGPQATGPQATKDDGILEAASLSAGLQAPCNIPIFFFYLINKFECYAKIISHNGKITNFQYKTIPLKYFSLYKIPTTMPNMAFKQIYPTV